MNHDPRQRRIGHGRSGGRRSAARAAAALFALCAVLGRAEPVAEDDALVREARAAALEFGGALKAQLEAAIAADGPAAAIAVCRSAAPALADAASTRFAGTVARTALRVRNPANAPDAYERAVLERFAAAAASGTDPATLEHAEILDADGRRTFRYLKAIPMLATPCGTCHGTDIDPELQARIRELYPADAATGFAPGEIRGAFTVVKDLR